MSKAVETIACPVCRTELSLEQITAHVDDDRAFARLVALTVPAARAVVAYVSLFTPPKQALTLRKKVRLIQQLLPDLRRAAITHRGRDWAAPQAAWEQAIEQMLAASAAGRLDLPMKSHAYLYSILMGLADKAEGAAEAQANAERFQAARAVPTAATVQVRGQTLTIGDALQQVHGGRDPALVKAEADARNAAPMPAAVRAQLAALRGKPTHPDTDTNTEDTAP
jgi:hypothetical protein